MNCRSKNMLSVAALCASFGTVLACSAVLYAQNATSEVEAFNSFGSTFGNNGAPGSGPGGGPPPGSGTQPNPSPTPETIEAKFTVAAQGKQIKFDCASCHWLEVHVDNRKLNFEETITLKKGKAYELTVKDNPQISQTPPQGSTPPENDTQTYTVWPIPADNQTITPIPSENSGDPPKAFLVQKDQVLQYLIDNSEGLLSENKPWPKNPSDEPMNKKARLLPFEINEVSFGGTKYWELKSDDAATTYSAPQWKDVDGNGTPTNTAQGERDYAVAFTRNTKPKIGAKFKIANASNFGAIKIKATAPGGVAIPETAATVSGDEVTLPLTESSSNLVNTIKFYDKKDDAKAFKLEWEVKIGSSDWSKIGTTKHSVYVTLDEPKTALRQESLFEIGCRNADGINQAAPVTGAIWNEFTDRVVKRVDGVQLTYYNTYTCSYISTEDLLKFGDGQCGAWAKFFIDLRKVHGIDDTNEYVIFYPSGPSNIPIDYRGFVVKNWTFSGSGTSGVANFPYVNIPANNLIGVNDYNWRYAEANDSNGIPGQGTQNPASLFNNHQVVIAGEYYDPSYGLKHASLAALDDSAIDGFYALTSLPVNESSVNLDLNGDGDQIDEDIPTSVFLFRKNTFGFDLTEERVNY